MELKQTASELKESMLNSKGFLFCQRCYKSNAFKFDIHHIVYRSEAPKHSNLHHPNNLIHVCKTCHDWFHSNKNNREDEVIKRQLWEQFPVILRKYKFNK